MFGYCSWLVLSISRILKCLDRALMPFGKQDYISPCVFSMRTSKQHLSHKGPITHHNPEGNKHSASGLLKWEQGAYMPYQSWAHNHCPHRHHHPRAKSLLAMRLSVLLCSAKIPPTKIIWSTLPFQRELTKPFQLTDSLFFWCHSKHQCSKALPCGFAWALDISTIIFFITGFHA